MICCHFLLPGNLYSDYNLIQRLILEAKRPVLSLLVYSRNELFVMEINGRGGPNYCNICPEPVHVSRPE